VHLSLAFSARIHICRGDKIIRASDHRRLLVGVALQSLGVAFVLFGLRWLSLFSRRSPDMAIQWVVV
jgi:hypothetical protein